MGFQFQIDNVLGSLADFDWKLSKYETQSGEKIGDKIKIAVVQRGLQDDQMRAHLVLHSSRLLTWEQVRGEVQAILTTRQALNGGQGQAAMDVGAVEGKSGKGRWKDKSRGKGKEKKGPATAVPDGPPLSREDIVITYEEANQAYGRLEATTAERRYVLDHWDECVSITFEEFKEMIDGFQPDFINIDDIPIKYLRPNSIYRASRVLDAYFAEVVND